jgi:hypothetical protein
MMKSEKRKRYRKCRANDPIQYNLTLAGGILSTGLIQQFKDITDEIK